MIKLILVLIVVVIGLVGWDLYNKVDLLMNNQEKIRDYINKWCITRDEFKD